MNITRTLSSLAAALLAALSASLASADVVETRSGARLVGTVTKIDGSAITLSTDYAGEIKVKQSEVVNLTTDNPLFMRLAAGTVIEGTAAPAGAGQITIRGAAGSVTTPVDQVAMTWAPGERDPATIGRTWAYEAAVDITGKNGNSDQLGTAFSFRATLKGAQDTLQFYTAYNRQETDDVKSADQFRAGVDYANNFSGRYSWYLRNEGGFDRVKDIELYNVAAAGFGYDVIKKANQTLTTRGGVSFRYEGYTNPLTEDVKSAGLDFGLSHRLQLNNGILNNSLSYVPAFDDFGNFRAIHDSFFEMPISASLWKLRIGLSNDYNSRPGVGVKKMDTTYYTRLVLNWD
jgi:putative salt-induced outer membrane protein YdiY